MITEFFISCNNFAKFILIFEFVEFMIVLISFLHFNLRYYHHSMTIKCRFYFKQLLTLNRIFVIWFSIFYAIPNKIFVSNNLNKFSVTFFIFLIIAISNIFAPFILLDIIFWVLVLESYFFAIFYENSIFFRNFINK